MKFRPIVTEASAKLVGENKYTFEVPIKLGKRQIADLCSRMFGVKVEKVWTSIVSGKSYRTGKRYKFATGTDWKKAVIKIAKDQKIDLFDLK